MFGGSSLGLVLVCPSNKLYMPYVENYEAMLEESNIEYDVINWDRFGIEERSGFIYRDNKTGHQRGLFDYYKFKRFAAKHLNSGKYDKVIVFGVPMAILLKRILMNEFKDNYVIDIRDHHKMINYFNIANIINESSFTVLSSPGFKKWLPSSNKYIINHNTQINSLNELKTPGVQYGENKINIAYIGAIRDYQINIDFINSLKNSNQIDLYFHGEGDINENIQKYLECNDINNVYLTGRYERKDEADLYLDSDIINVLRYNDGINNETALPNRLYNASIYGKPMVAFEGTYLAEQIKKHNLGLIINSLDNIENKIHSYLRKFDADKYEQGRKFFFEFVIKQNNRFRVMLKDLITG